MKREVTLPERFKATLGLPHGHDYHLVDIRLLDGRKFFGLPVIHEALIVGTKASGESIDLNFEAEDIQDVRRARANFKAVLGIW